MPTISLKAILNNANLTGAAINLREGIASFCSTDNPSTGQTLKEIAKRIGMDTGQASRALAILEEKGEVKVHKGKFYLLKLDDYQIERIAKKNFELLKTLSRLGCDEAKREVDKQSILNDSESILSRFLLQFFLFSELTESHLKMTHGQFRVDGKSILNDSESIPLKENNGVNVLLNGVMGEEAEGGDVASKRDAFPAAASAGASADSDSLPNGDKDEPRADILNSGKNHDERQKTIWVETHTRKDIAALNQWLTYIESLPECRNIQVRKLWQKLLRKCKKHGSTASRGRFLANWLWPDVKDQPEEILEEEIEENAIAEYEDKPVTENERRRRAASTRIEFGKFAKERLESEGIVQVGDL